MSKMKERDVTQMPAEAVVAGSSVKTHSYVGRDAFICGGHDSFKCGT